MHAVCLGFWPETGVDARFEQLLQVGHSCNFWENYEADLQRNVDMGCTSMRFSLEWHRIEPERGQFSSDAIAHYHKILSVMEKCVAAMPPRTSGS
jgi:beta-glucosidase/6-phospho-beta-glucosidase/beta-galactosidase